MGRNGLELSSSGCEMASFRHDHPVPCHILRFSNFFVIVAKWHHLRVFDKIKLISDHASIKSLIIDRRYRRSMPCMILNEMRYSRPQPCQNAELPLGVRMRSWNRIVGAEAGFVLSDLHHPDITQSRTLRASAARRSTTDITALPHSLSAVVTVAMEPSGFHSALACFSASLCSKTTQLSILRVFEGSHRTRVGLVGTS